jgi:hypothetical protein
LAEFVPDSMNNPTLGASQYQASSRALAALATWWHHPRLTWWLLIPLAALLALRKPDALLTPQFWAEDGSVFLIEADQLGLAAFLTPYMGYLHTIPRLVAWLSARLLDPAWWPALYNGTAFAIWLAVIARMFSPRLPLPHKPWLALLVFVGPQTGEILFNLTNVQWIAAFVLVQQAIIARPLTRAQRLGDLALLAVIGLTGPFIVAVLPLFVWRWWRDRHPDNLAALVLATACAATQAWLIHRANITFEHQHAPFHLFNALTVLSRRLLIWPALGPTAAHDLPAIVIATVGTLFAATLFVHALRPHPRRLVRLQLFAALALLTIAGFVRMRPDTWSADDLAFSDRYFFLPRVLLAWLIVLAIDADSKWGAWTARVVAVFMSVVHLQHYRLPAPPNYLWSERCDPIRRGVPAKIPILPEGWILDYPGRFPTKP